MTTADKLREKAKGLRDASRYAGLPEAMEALRRHADALDLLADAWEALNDPEPFWNPTCTLDPCEDCAVYRSLIQRIDSYAEGRKT